MMVKSEMKMRCQRCGARMRLWKTKCPYCHQSMVSGLHIVVIIALATTAAFYLLKMVQ